MPKKPRDGKPERRVTAYGFFLRESRLQQKDQDPQQPPDRTASAEFTRQCAVRWRTMTAKEKKRFVRQSVKDKERFESEMKEYLVSMEQQRPPKKPMVLKDPNAPKRPLSSFFFFCSEQRPNVRATLQASRMGAIAKELGRLWTAVSLDDRVKYNLMADEDKERYSRELTVYKQKKREIEEAIAAQMVLLAQRQR